MQIACPFCQGMGVIAIRSQSKLEVPNVEQKPTFIICPQCQGTGIQEAGFMAKRLQEEEKK